MKKRIAERKTLYHYLAATMVLGAVQREGKVKLIVIPETDVENINQAILEFVKPDSTMVSDEHTAYNKVGVNYNHRAVKHKAKEYVRREEDIVVYTNSIEGLEHP